MTFSYVQLNRYIIGCLMQNQMHARPVVCYVDTIVIVLCPALILLLPNFLSLPSTLKLCAHWTAYIHLT